MSTAQNPYAAPRAQVADQADKATSAAGPHGIRGWLILPLLGLIFTPLRTGLMTVKDVLPALQPETWHALTTPGTKAYHPLWAPVIGFELAANCLIIAAAITLVWLFFRKSKRVPMLMVAWYVGTILVQIIDLLLAGQIPAVAAQQDSEGIKELGRSIAVAMIWIPYFLVSKRVKNTFVE